MEAQFKRAVTVTVKGTKYIYIYIYVHIYIYICTYICISLNTQRKLGAITTLTDVKYHAQANTTNDGNSETKQEKKKSIYFWFKIDFQFLSQWKKTSEHKPQCCATTVLYSKCEAFFRQQN